MLYYEEESLRANILHIYVELFQVFSQLHIEGYTSNQALNMENSGNERDGREFGVIRKLSA